MGHIRWSWGLPLANDLLRRNHTLTLVEAKRDRQMSELLVLGTDNDRGVREVD